MTAAPKLRVLPTEPGRILREQERKRAQKERERLQAIVEAATGYECDNTEPLESPVCGQSEITQERRLDGRRRRRVTSCRVSSVGVAAWMWRAR